MKAQRRQRGALLTSAAFLTAGISLGAIVLSLLLLTGGSPRTAEAFTLGPATNIPNNAGQTLTINNEEVQLDFISQSAGFNNEFGRALPAPLTSYFFCHSAPSGIINGGRFAGPQELRFYLTTPAQGSPSTPKTFYTGPGSNNVDGFAHARMTQISSNTVRLEWEDLLNGGDQDYNDCIIDIIITPLATLTICKDVRGDDGGATAWTVNVDGPDALSDRTAILTDGGCTTEQLLTPGAYTVTETTQPGGYVTSMDCGGKGSSGSNTIGFSLAAGESATCTVYNDTTATFQVFKDFVPDDPQNVNVTLICSSGTVTTIDGNTSETDPADFQVDRFSPGATCTASEAPPPSGYTNTSNCSAVPINPGGASSCTFTNTSDAQIAFCKDVVPNDASTWVATLTGPTAKPPSPPIGDGSCHTFATLAPGSYTLTESGPAGYAPAYSCTNGQSASAVSVTIALGPGEQVTCTFTNTGFGSIEVCKTVVINDGSTWPFSVSGPTPGNGTLTSGTCSLLSSRAPGNYTVAETVPVSGYQPSYSCTLGKGSGPGGGVTFNLGPGENVKCTFTNTLTASITICKQVIPPDATTWAFTLTGPAGGSSPALGNGQCHTFPNRPAGSYTLSEPDAGAYSESYSCDNGKGSGSGSSATFSLAPGEQVTCNFLNQQYGSITIVKDAVPDDPQDFEFVCDTPIGILQLDDDTDGTLPNTSGAILVPAGTYSCTETQVNGWLISIECDDSDSGGSGGTATIVVSAGEDVSCTFTNTFTAQEPLAVGGVAGLIEDGGAPPPLEGAAGDDSGTPIPALLLVGPGGALIVAIGAAWIARRRLPGSR